MRASQRLRKATAVAHKAAEVSLDAAAILNHSLTRRGFERMILLHHKSWAAAESLFRSFSGTPHAEQRFLSTMVEQLQKDLQQLGLTVPATPCLQLNAGDFATLYGVRYVLRGSTLGATLINRHLVECDALSGLSGFHFHSTCEALPGKEWPAFLREMDASVVTEVEISRAVVGATAVFELYTAV